MLRKFLIATALLATSGTALAHSEYGRVVSVEPHFAISVGSGHHDGFRVLYESGGSRYWTHTPYHPGHVIVLPQHRVRHVHHHRNHGWDDRRGWDDHRGGRHDDRREYRRDRRHHGRD